MPQREFVLDRERCALLVIDMQEYFCNPESTACVPDARKILGKVQKLISVFKKHGRPIFFTQHIDDVTDKHNMMLLWWQENITPDTPFHELSKDIDISCGTLLVKHQYDAFFGTRLEKMLHDKKVVQVVVAGVLTNLCCETTARSAFMRGFEVVFVPEATGTYSEKMFHGSIVNLSYGFAHMVKVSDMVHLFNDDDQR